jgi:hypothetical protein
MLAQKLDPQRRKYRHRPTGAFSMGIRYDILKMITDYQNSPGNAGPTRIYLTADDEQALASMSRDEAGGDVTGMVRKDYEALFGKEVVWDSPMRKCE